MTRASGGIINHYTGAAFNLVPSRLRVDFDAGTTVRNGSVYAVSQSEIFRVTPTSIVGEFPLIGSPLAMTAFGDEAWAVGHGGGIAHLSMGRWSEQVPAVGTLLDLHGSANDNVWAVGPEPLGLVMHYDGRTWSRDLVPQNLVDATLSKVLAISRTDAWAFGAYRQRSGAPFVNLVLRHDGTQWTQVATPTRNHVNAVCGTGGQVFSVGDRGEIARFDGTSWSLLTSTTTSDLLAVRCSSPADVWAGVFTTVGPTLVHWDGTSWSLVHGGPTESVSSFVGFASDDLFAFGHTQWHFDGRQWTMVRRLPQSMGGFVGVGPNDLWSRSAGNIWHFDGAGWSPSAFNVDFVGFNALWAHGPEVLAAGRSIARHR